METPLQLTSPLMAGADVTRLQRLMARAGWYLGKITGRYDEATAQAVYRSQFWLGYRKPTQAAGAPLFALLDGSQKPSPAMRARTALRRRRDAAKRKKAGELTHAQRIVQNALTQLGQKENPPDTNRSKFSAWYGIVGPWCAMFVTWVHETVGFYVAAFKQGSRYSYVPAIVDAARAGRSGLMLAHWPADGIVVCFDWDRDGTADHVGICALEATLRHLDANALAAARATFGSLAGGDFWTIEGNTGIGNDSNGGEVLIRKRNLSMVQAFVKVAT